jgi:hypothetical protein
VWTRHWNRSWRTTGVFGVLFKDEDGHLARFSAVVGVPLSLSINRRVSAAILQGTGGAYRPMNKGQGRCGVAFLAQIDRRS